MRAAPFLPFLRGPADFTVGLRPIPPALQFLPDTDEVLAEKRALIETRLPEVYAAQDLAGEGEALAAAAVAAAKARLGPAHLPPLARAAWSMLDDPVVMVRTPEGLWVAGALCLCAPTFFSAASALGKPLADLHDPVPDRLGPKGAQGLGPRIARVFEGLTAGLVLERFNWTVQAGPDRFTPTSAALRARAAAANPSEAAQLLHLRVERQTVAALAPQRFVLFTIRVEIDPLAPILADPGARAAFTAAWAATPAHVRAYKGWAVYEPLVRALLA